MTNLQKKEIQNAILLNNEKKGKGAQADLARKCTCSGSLITQIVNGNWNNITDEKWQKIAAVLNVDIENKEDSWQIAETIDYKRVTNICNNAKNFALFQIISDKAGVGKSAPLKSYSELNADQGVFYIRCREWAKREFLTELCTLLGIDTGKSFLHIDKLGQKVSDFFYKRSTQKPLLIIDEADKLKDSALRFFIHLYNENEDKMAVIIAGTPHLQQRITRGVKLKKLGFDELDSRFGRSFLGLTGATENCTRQICTANGINDKLLQKKFFEDLKPVFKEIKIDKQVQNIKVVDDLRRLKRLIIIEKIKQNH